MNWITYETKHGTLGGGWCAETAESPLTGTMRIRVVDRLSECSDPEAGKWIAASDVVDDGQPKPSWMHNPAN